MPSVNRSGRTYWRSLEEYADTPEFREFMHREFPAGATDLLGETERRSFLKIMGASLALAGLGMSGCRRWPAEEIAPYAERPEGRSPGVPVRYATTMESGGVGTGLVVTSYDGRPIKVDGNPGHPGSLGATSAYEQATILDLYDPDRSRQVLHDQQPSSWAAFVEAHAASFQNLRSISAGAGLCILSEATSSPTVAALRATIAASMPQAAWFEYEPLANDHELVGSRLAFGAPHRTRLHLDEARVIVSLDSDFLMTHPAAVTNARGFATRRSPESPGDWMSRFYAFESTVSVTGANADDRIAVAHADVAAVAAALAAELLGDAARAPFAALAERGRTLVPGAVFTTLLADLRAHRGHSVIIAGADQPAEVHCIAHLLNGALGNVGHTVTYAALPADARGHVESIRALADRIGSGAVRTLLILGGNPAYDAPADLDFGARLKQVDDVIHLSSHVDETSALANWHLPRAHYLETWSDTRGWDGTYAVGQPLILPLFGGRSAIEVLSLLTGESTMSGQDLVRRTFEKAAPGRDWRRALHDGVLADTASAAVTPAPRANAAGAAAQGLASRPAGDTGFELRFVVDNTVRDGRGANNGWLQELPDPITKLTWDNAVLLNPSTAQSMSIRSGDVVRVSRGGTVITAAALLQPGMPARTAALALGYGRRFAGQVCAEAGTDAYPLRRSDAMSVATGVSIERTGDTYPLATTQDHHAIETESVGGKAIQERLPQLFREADLPEYWAETTFAAHRAHVPHRLSLWEEPALEGKYAWAMSIDLGKCTGCNACVTACQAENNIPIVGKDQVLRGREMHWIRIDRYYRFESSGDHGWDSSKLRSIAMQPVTCMHCENAPCEQVCPVAATVHDHNGLNVMVYNRCVGTRYCSNNCPYKVRRFNYFDYHRRDPLRSSGMVQVQPSYWTRQQAGAHPLKRMQFNPEVTVRMRGIMEKCTFCVQRLTQAQIEAKNAWVRGTDVEKAADARVAIPDAAIETACAQACPTDAIIFGDRNDPTSRVAAAQKRDRSYEMLEELNVKARTKYLAKVRNPAVPHAAEAGHGGGHGDGASGPGDDHAHSEAGQHS